jgi:hypothetical protein
VEGVFASVRTHCVEEKAKAAQEERLDRVIIVVDSSLSGLSSSSSALLCSSSLLFV